MRMSKTLHKDISFSPEIQMVKAKMNSYLDLPLYSLFCMSNIKGETITIITVRRILTEALENNNGQHFN